MPIQWPPLDRYPQFSTQDDTRDFAPAFDVTNLGIIGVEFVGGVSDDSLNPGMPGDSQARPVNLRNPGFGFEQADQYGMAPPAIPLPITGRGVYQQTDWAASNRVIVGVTRDSGGAVLGNVVVDLFITGSDSIVGTTTSDASGNFSFSNPGTGPFYIVAYKAGAPDVAGTSVNTLLPTLP
jgi:hypothetical protein